MRVLVVEDEPDVREMVRWALEAQGGFAVEECEAPERVVDLVRAGQPDLVLLDVMMPETDGVTVARQLRMEPDTAGVAIVFMTACLRPEQIAGYVELGALDVVAKPFDPLKLPARLRSAMAAAAVPPPQRPDALHALEHGYRVELPDRVRDIESALARLASQDLNVAQEAALLAHRLAGSAAIFGMSDLSETARALEDAVGRFFIEDEEASRRSIEGLVGELRRRADAQAAV
jgi:DNA-binding response OmpR family regulator